MASAPSASALAAVLRCRRNIWTRTPPTKRPSASVCGLGPAGGRDSPAERSASTRASAWEAVPQGESVAVTVGGTLTVSYRHGGRVSREKSKLRDPRLWQAPGDARSAGGRPGRAAGSDTDQRCSAHVRQSAFVKDTRGLPAGVLKLSVTSCPGWSALRSACSSLTAAPGAPPCR